MRTAVWLLAAVAFGGAGQAAADGSSLRFDSERICLSIVGDSLEVRGRYVLLCGGESPRGFPLFYPFPRDSLLGGWRMLSLRVRGGLADPGPTGDLEARWEAVPGIAAVRWWLPPCPGDSLVAEAVYRQALRSAYARYIVTTTKAWGRPLRRAAFEIRLPAGAEPVEFSFPFARRPGEEPVWTYEATDFLPEEDIVVRWRE